MRAISGQRNLTSEKRRPGGPLPSVPGTDNSRLGTSAVGDVPANPFGQTAYVADFEASSHFLWGVVPRNGGLSAARHARPRRGARAWRSARRRHDRARGPVRRGGPEPPARPEAAERRGTRRRRRRRGGGAAATARLARVLAAHTDDMVACIHRRTRRRSSRRTARWRSGRCRTSTTAAPAAEVDVRLEITLSGLAAESGPYGGDAAVQSLSSRTATRATRAQAPLRGASAEAAVDAPRCPRCFRPSPTHPYARCTPLSHVLSLGARSVRDDRVERGGPALRRDEL